MFRQLTALFLALMLVFSCLPVFAEDNAEIVIHEVGETADEAAEEIADDAAQEDEEDPYDESTAADAATDLSDEELAEMERIGSMLDDEENPDGTADISTLEINENLPDNVVNILLLGIDNRSIKLVSGRSDAMIICSINTDTGSVKLTSFCRDLAVTIPGYKNIGPINTAFKFGSKDGDIEKGALLAMHTVNKNFSMNIQYYAVVNIYGLAAIIDAVGGVDMDMTSEEVYQINYEMFVKEPMNKDGVKHTKLERKNGVQHLDGMQATTYGRIRKLNGQNDVNRNGRQRALLSAVISKVMDGLDFIGLLNLVETALPYCQTNLTTAEIATLGMAILSGDTMSAVMNGNLEEAIGSFGIPMVGEYGYKTFGSKSCVYISDIAKKNGEPSRFEKTMTSWFDFLYEGACPYTKDSE